METEKATPQRYSEIKAKLTAVFNSAADKECKQQEFENRHLLLKVLGEIMTMSEFADQRKHNDHLIMSFVIQAIVNNRKANHDHWIGDLRANKFYRSLTLVLL